jgi:sporulation protein YtfJ
MDRPKSKMNEVIEALLSKMRELADSETIVGESITTPDGVTIIPISRLSCGFGAGGTDFNTRHNSNQVLFGGGGGGGIELTPVSFIVISDGKVQILPASGTVAAPLPASSVVSTVDKLVDDLPGMVEKLEAFIAKRREKKAKEKQEGEKPASNGKSATKDE